VALYGTIVNGIGAIDDGSIKVKLYLPRKLLVCFHALKKETSLILSE